MNGTHSWKQCVQCQQSAEFLNSPSNWWQRATDKHLSIPRADCVQQINIVSLQLFRQLFHNILCIMMVFSGCADSLSCLRPYLFVLDVQGFFFLFYSKVTHRVWGPDVISPCVYFLSYSLTLRCDDEMLSKSSKGNPARVEQICSLLSNLVVTEVRSPLDSCLQLRLTKSRNWRGAMPEW